ncbi:unnamed protein product [Allacma fusca]|uniref:Uncharacterized protein n=1 Tax=Allacma fusca TaxID=39272 RepID=A0A8J2JSF7_9HEXA|nr:unnamed protein product [Allacma fusca]
MALKRKAKGSTGQKGGRRPNFRHAESTMYFNDPHDFQNSNAEGDKEFDDGAETEDKSGEDGASLNNSNESNSQVVVTVTNVDLPIPTLKAYVTKKSKLDPFEEHLLDVVKGQELSEYQHFGQSVAIKLQCISEIDRKRACRLQNDIQNMLFDAEMNILM